MNRVKDVIEIEVVRALKWEGWDHCPSVRG